MNSEVDSIMQSIYIYLTMSKAFRASYNNRNQGVHADLW